MRDFALAAGQWITELSMPGVLHDIAVSHQPLAIAPIGERGLIALVRRAAARAAVVLAAIVAVAGAVADSILMPFYAVSP